MPMIIIWWFFLIILPLVIVEFIVRIVRNQPYPAIDLVRIQTNAI